MREADLILKALHVQKTLDYSQFRAYLESQVARRHDSCVLDFEVSSLSIHVYSIGCFHSEILWVTSQPTRTA